MASILKTISLFTVIIFIISCKSKPSPFQPKEVPDSARYYQVSNFINEEVTAMKKVPYFIRQYTITNNTQRDSVVLDTTDIEKWAEEFIVADISGDKIKKNYREDVFNDNTSGYTTITYSILNNSTLPVKFLSIYLDPENDNVKRIEIKKIYDKNDSLITENLSWRSEKGFSVNRVTEKDKAVTTKQITVSWNE